jgi:hypothetical protein
MPAESAASVKVLKVRVRFLAGTSPGSMTERPLMIVTDRGTLKLSVPATRLKIRWAAPEKALCPEVYSPNGGLTTLASW